MNRREAIKGLAASLLGAPLAARARMGRGGVVAPTVQNILGANAFDPVGYSSGPVWLNLMKHASSNSEFCPWFTGSSGTFDTGEEAYLASTLDSNYYPTTLTVSGIPGGQQFTKLFTYIFQNMGSLASGQTYFYPPGSYTLGVTAAGSGGEASVTFQVTGDVSSLTGSANLSVSGSTVTSTLAPGASGTVTFTASGSGGFVITIPAGSGISSSCYLTFPYLVETSLLSSYNAGEIIHPNYKAALQAGWSGPIRFMGAQKTYFQDWKLTFTGTVSGTSGGTIATNGLAVKGASYSTWPFPSGTWPVIFATGQVIDCNFTYGSSAVTWSTALSSAVTTSAIAAMAMLPMHQRTWADRALLSHMSWALYMGLPLEALVIACNEINLPPWTNVPGCTNFTDPTWSTNLAKLLHDGTGANIADSNQSSFTGLAPGLLARIEYTNECWGTYLSTNLVEMMSVPAGFYAAQGNNQFYGGQEWYGTQVAGIADAFSSVYGAGIASRVRIQWMNQFATGNGTVYMEMALNTPDWTSRAYSHASGFGAKGFAPYWGTDAINATDAATIKALADPVGEMFSLMYTNRGTSGNTYSSVPTAGFIGNYVDIANSLIESYAGQPWTSWPIECYEGGSALDDASDIEASVSGWRVNVLDAVQTDARFQYTYYDPTHQLSTNNGYLPMLQALGVSFICQLAMVGNAMSASTAAGGGNWGTLVSVMQIISPLSSAPPKFQGCINYAKAA